jgi:hypothetical protein
VRAISVASRGVPGRRPVGIPGRGSLRPPAASRCSALRATRSFPRRPPAYVLPRSGRCGSPQRIASTHVRAWAPLLPTTPRVRAAALRAQGAVGALSGSPRHTFAPGRLSLPPVSGTPDRRAIRLAWSLPHQRPDGFRARLGIDNLVARARLIEQVGFEASGSGLHRRGGGGGARRPSRGRRAGRPSMASGGGLHQRGGARRRRRGRGAGGGDTA